MRKTEEECEEKAQKPTVLLRHYQEDHDHLFFDDMILRDVFNSEEKKRLCCISSLANVRLNGIDQATHQNESTYSTVLALYFPVEKTYMESDSFFCLYMFAQNFINHSHSFSFAHKDEKEVIF